MPVRRWADPPRHAQATFVARNYMTGPALFFKERGAVCFSTKIP
jgi:hypothetical protein